MTTTAVWSNALQAVIDADGLEVVDGDRFVFRCPTVARGAMLYCYCACRVPYDDTRWVLAVAPKIDDRHDPQHAVEFRFPFQLPLYPKGDVAFVAVSLQQAGTALRPLYLADVPPAPLHATHVLTAKEWVACEAKWTAALGNTCDVLSAAFDNMWDCTVHDVGGGSRPAADDVDGLGEGGAGIGSGGAGSGLSLGLAARGVRSSKVGVDADSTGIDGVGGVCGAVLAGLATDTNAFVSTDAIDEVDYDVDEEALNTTLLLSRLGAHGASADEFNAATATDDLLNDDDDTRIDIHTGLVASSVACIDDNDDDMESIDGNTDADDDEEEEDDDEDEDDDDIVE